MFSKLLKYDFKSVRKIGLPVLIVCWSLTVLGMIVGYIAGSSITEAENELAIMYAGMGTVAMGMIIFAIAICASIISILVYVEFYKSLCTDQAYLTFTLPVKSTSLLNSKLVNSLLWSVMSVASAIGGIFLVILAFGMGLPDMGSSGGATDSIFSILDFGNAVFNIIMMVAYAVNTQLLFFMVIFFASIITSRHKAATAIGLVLAANMAYSLIYSLISTIVYEAVESTGDLASILSSVIGTILLVASGVGYYFLTKYMMEKKLNLA